MKSSEDEANLLDIENTKLLTFLQSEVKKCMKELWSILSDKVDIFKEIIEMCFKIGKPPSPYYVYASNVVNYVEDKIENSDLENSSEQIELNIQLISSYLLCNIEPQCSLSDTEYGVIRAQLENFITSTSNNLLGESNFTGAEENES